MSETVAFAALEAKEAHLRAIFRELGSCVVAFSGGVDSALVLHVAAQELGPRALGVTARSESLAEREYAGALRFADGVDARHEVVETRELEDPSYAANPVDRCYFCKRELYATLAGIARERGLAAIVDGYNRDDEGDWRPGRRAASEYAVRSPLYEAELRKADVRALARAQGLDVWDKPALACLSSRFPYGTPITLELLRQVDRAEQAVHDAGLRACRVRHHGEIARIEVPLEDIAAVADPERRARIVAGVRAAGYRYVTLDLGGYVSGGFDPAAGSAARHVTRPGDARSRTLAGMSASETLARSNAALELILSRASAITLKAPGPSRDDLRLILQAGTRAPDHGKVQPWRFTVVEGDARDRLGDLMAETLRARDPQITDVEVRRERDKVFRAPTIVVVGAKIVEHKIPAPEQHSAAAAAAENVILGAHALGYGTMWKTGAPAYDDRVKAFFGLEPRDAIIGFLYLGTADVMPKNVRETKFDEVVRWL